ncbi:DUF423 domain-containing protein [Methylocapsa aurea]|uniref:DUF423 domain-containing protein n=1 Tax=Methylocapsa aurea TaxID=663610 RepID=UPI000565FAB1|nr:DUF423 domain-containing protein [Methylocapsa aurea]
MPKIALTLAALAGLAGGGGVILAALAAHGGGGPQLETAANFLMLHAAATLAVCGLALAAPRRGGQFLGAAAIFLLGSLLFCGDLSMRTLAAAKLFPMAAPIGGTLLVLGWAWVAAASVLALPPREPREH